MKTSRTHRRFSFGVLLLSTFLLVFTACTDQEEAQVRETAEETAQAAQADVEAFKQEFQSSLNNADQQLQQVSQRIDTSAEQANAELQEELTDIRQRRDQLEKQVGDLQASGVEEFRQARADLRSRMNHLEHDLRVARLESIESKEEFVQAVQAELEDINQEMNQLNQNLDGTGENVRAEYSQTMEALKKERKLLKENLSELEQAGSSEFKDMRVAIAEDVAALGSEINQASNELESATRSRTAARTEEDGPS